MFVPFAQLKRLCNFFHFLWGWWPRPPGAPLATPMLKWLFQQRACSRLNAPLETLRQY